MTLKKTEPDLPFSVGVSPVEARVSSGSLLGWGHWQQESWKVPLDVSHWKIPLGVSLLDVSTNSTIEPKDPRAGSS